MHRTVGIKFLFLNDILDQNTLLFEKQEQGWIHSMILSRMIVRFQRFHNVWKKNQLISRIQDISWNPKVFKIDSVDVIDS